MMFSCLAPSVRFACVRPPGQKCLSLPSMSSIPNEVRCRVADVCPRCQARRSAHPPCQDGQSNYILGPFSPPPLATVDRAVLCRGGVAVALSHDHKPMSVTEKTRIQRAGGFVNSVRRRWEEAGRERETGRETRVSALGTSQHLFCWHVILRFEVFRVR